MSEKGRKRKQKMKYWIMLLSLMCLVCLSFGVKRIQVEAAKSIEEVPTEKIEEKAKNGIVEIVSGFCDAQGRFRKMQSGSGFLIRNTENETYIVTNRAIVTNSESAKKKYCEKKKIAIEGNIPETIIKVIVKGDVSVEAEIVAESQEKDFCILNTENVVSEKNALELENSTRPQAGDVVYALGFPKEKNLEYIPEEVECSLGVIDASELNWQDVLHIKHTAHLSEGSIGGPLLNEAGYVVGLNCKKILEDETEVYCALPIAEVIEVLDNFAIYYDNSMRDQWNVQLNELYQESIELYGSKDYKKESLEELQKAIAAVDKLWEKEELSVEELEQTYIALKEAKEELVPKMSKMRIVIYVLAGVILLLAVRLVQLLILKCIDKKREVAQLQQPEYRTLQEEQLQQPGYMTLPEEQPQPLEYKTLTVVQQRTGQKFTVTDIRVVVGKSLATSDFCVTGNKVVSRQHAAFQQQNGKFYVCDLHSSNGTFLNGQRIPAECDMEIKAGDVVVLANEEFVVQ